MKRDGEPAEQAEVPPPPPKQGVDEVSREQGLIADEWAPNPPPPEKLPG
jgi:hypothetical protein